MKGRIFNQDQIRAIQSGKMTQFMQEVKPQPWDCKSEYNGAGFAWSKKGINSDSYAWNTSIESLCGQMAERSPFGKVGDVIYCRESWHYWDRPDRFVYKADPPIFFPHEKVETNPFYSPATMPREAARSFLRITNIRVMRVRELTEWDAFLQGFGIKCECIAPVVPGACENCMNTGYSYPPLMEMQNMIPDVWEANKYFWIIDFTKCEKP